ncbi:hypothetical protein [Streptomyces sp. enrichment culture]|uniref:hypothetical protein n=1 Tax=Streptomyces sp. enrichment culture TaxID=1795815 RepID=UPI003F55A9D6
MTAVVRQRLRENCLLRGLDLWEIGPPRIQPVTTHWYVLVEEAHVDYEHESWSCTPSWELRRTEHVAGDRKDAEAAGLELAKKHIPESFYVHPGDQPHRSVFSTQSGAWIVSLKSRRQQTHFRVTTGQLVHSEEELVAPLPEWFPEYHSTWSHLKFLLGGSFTKRSKA